VGRASFQGLSLFCGSSQERPCSAVSRKQILGLLILCGAVILHTTLWPYNFRFDWGSVPARLLSQKRPVPLPRRVFPRVGCFERVHAGPGPFPAGVRRPGKGVSSASTYFIVFLAGSAFALCLETLQIAYTRSSAKRPFLYLSATLLAAASQSVIETGRAFTEYRHPDVTNVLLAALGAAVGMYLYHRALSFPFRTG